MPPLNKAELVAVWRDNFSNHTPTKEGHEKIEKIRSATKLLAEVLIDNCPTSRELSLALTSLEEASFHANSAVARHFNEETAVAKKAMEDSMSDEEKAE